MSLIAKMSALASANMRNGLVPQGAPLDPDSLHHAPKTVGTTPGPGVKNWNEGTFARPLGMEGEPSMPPRPRVQSPPPDPVLVVPPPPLGGAASLQVHNGGLIGVVQDAEPLLPPLSANTKAMLDEVLANKKAPSVVCRLDAEPLPQPLSANTKAMLDEVLARRKKIPPMRRPNTQPLSPPLSAHTKAMLDEVLAHRKAPSVVRRLNAEPLPPPPLPDDTKAMPEEVLAHSNQKQQQDSHPMKSIGRDTPSKMRWVIYLCIPTYSTFCRLMQFLFQTPSSTS